MKPLTVQHIVPKGHHLERLRELLLHGAESKPTEPVDPAYFERLRNGIQGKKSR